MSPVLNAVASLGEDSQTTYDGYGTGDGYGYGY